MGGWGNHQTEEATRARERAEMAEEALRVEAGARGLPDREPLVELACLKKHCVTLEESRLDMDR